MYYTRKKFPTQTKKKRKEKKRKKKKKKKVSYSIYGVNHIHWTL